MKINRSSINFTTLVLLFAPWGDPPLGVLAVQNVRGKGSGGLFDRPGEDDPVQKIEVCMYPSMHLHVFFSDSYTP